MTSVDAVSAAVGAAVAEAATYPLCTLKTNVQCRDLVSWDSLRRFVASQNDAAVWGGGVGWLYRGLPWAVASQAVTSSGKWFGYQFLNARNASLPWSGCVDWQRRVANGVVSGVVVSTLTHLSDFVRVHRQMQHERRLQPEWKVSTTEIALDSARTMYRGFSKTLGKTVVGGATYLPIFQQLREVHGWNVVAAALASSVVSLTLSAPFDYMKQRRIYGLESFDRKLLDPRVGWGFLMVANRTRLHLIRTMYTGWSLSLARVVPHFVIWMTVTDLLRPTLQQAIRREQVRRRTVWNAADDVLPPGSIRPGRRPLFRTTNDEQKERPH